MRSLLVVLAVVGVAVAKPGFLGLGARSLVHAPVAYSSVHAPVAYSTLAAAAPIAHHYAHPYAASSQYHAQDELGQYSYGYSGGPSAKSEIKTFDGVTRGGYSYVDAEGKVQNVNYVADAVHGFRVAATNLPVAPEPIPAEPLVGPAPVHDTVEVAAAKSAHFAAVAEAKVAAEAAPDVSVFADTIAVEPAAVSVARADLLPASVLSRTVVSPGLAYGAIAPAAVSYSAVAHAPVAYSGVAPALAHSHLAYGAHYGGHYGAHYGAHYGGSSQYHAQDELGQYSYGYSGGPSAKSEIKTFDGVTRGGYSYVDPVGQVQSVNYVSDPAHGFRVAATNLPVAPSAVHAPILEGIADTVEVAAAKAHHFAAHEEAKARLLSA